MREIMNYDATFQRDAADATAGISCTALEKRRVRRLAFLALKRSREQSHALHLPLLQNTRLSSNEANPLSRSRELAGGW